MTTDKTVHDLCFGVYCHATEEIQNGGRADEENNRKKAMQMKSTRAANDESDESTTRERVKRVTRQGHRDRGNVLSLDLQIQNAANAQISIDSSSGRHKIAIRVSGSSGRG